MGIDNSPLLHLYLQIDTIDRAQDPDYHLARLEIGLRRSKSWSDCTRHDSNKNVPRISWKRGQEDVRVEGAVGCNFETH